MKISERLKKRFIASWEGIIWLTLIPTNGCDEERVKEEEEEEEVLLTPIPKFINPHFFRFLKQDKN